MKKPGDKTIQKGIGRFGTEAQLSPEIYDQLEHENSAEMSIPVLQAFRPVTYMEFGYPVRVKLERELQRMVDHNFEGEVPAIFEPGAYFEASCFTNSFTPDEARLVEKIRDRVADLCVRSFGRSIRPITTLIVQVAPFRIMSEISRVAGKPSLSVFEAGPGLAYLGALLAMQGHRHVSFDVTQAMYLWQNRLLSEFAGDEFCEGALYPGPLPFEESRVVHIPWWRYVDCLHAGPMQTADVVYSNSNLCEMHPFALRMLLHVAKRMLTASDVGLFCFMGSGHPGQTSVEGMHNEFIRQGYKKLEGMPFQAYAPDDRDVSPYVEAFANGVPHFNPSGFHGRLDATELLKTDADELPLDVAATEWFYGWNSPRID